jgi:pimeloyl-ACP methyl ester carboxylesterase
VTLALLSAALAAFGAPALAGDGGRLVRWDSVASRGLEPRNVTVWLPPGYDASLERYPVIYMQDGQNLFEASTSGPKGEWGIDEAITALSEKGEIRPAIVVGVWSTKQRSRDYMPAKVFQRLPSPWREQMLASHGGPPLSDRYLDFLANELKPRVDREFRTLPGRDHTFIGGSSMGALISLYAITEHPEVFGGAAGVSMHWPLFGSWPVKPRPEDEKAAAIATWSGWLREALPSPATHKLYFDRGTETLDSLYAPYAAEIDPVIVARGYVPGCSLLSREFPGAEHDEPAWRARLDVPLRFFLGPAPAGCGATRR